MRPVKTVVVSSLDGGVGKTTLAAVLAAAKEYVLLIDMDWEKADLSQLFRAPRKPGWLAPFLDGRMPYVHKVNEMLYVVPGYEACEVYQREGESVEGDFADVVLEWAEVMPKFVSKLRLPIDTVVIDTTAALRVELLAKLQKHGAYNIFMADQRIVSRISDVKVEQYRRYMAYSALTVVNRLEKDELRLAKRIAPVVLRRVKMPQDYYGMNVANAILQDRENRKAVEHIVMRLKTA